MDLYLSRLRLNPLNRAAARNLSHPYELHRTLLKAFPNADLGGPGRVLFRSELDLGGGTPHATVLVQSEREPDWIEAVREYPTGLLLSSPEARILHAAFEVGTILRFRLRANPTSRRIRLPDGTPDERRQRPRHALYREADQVAWLVRQGRGLGFEPMHSDLREWLETEWLPVKYDIIAQDEGTIRTGKKTVKGVSRHHSVLFEGRLRVTDSASFGQALRSGVGPAKAFGFGLLSVAPVNR